MLHYLFYRLYRAYLTNSGYSQIPDFSASMHLVLLISLNVLTLNLFLVKLKLTSYSLLSINKFMPFLLAFCLISFIYFANKKRQKKIIEKYSTENNTDRIRGSIIVGIYVALSFLLIFAVAFFRHG